MPNNIMSNTLENQVTKLTPDQVRQIPPSAKEVSKESFFDSVGKKDVTPTPLGSWPYVSHWKTRDRITIGWSAAIPCQYEGESRYFVP